MKKQLLKKLSACLPVGMAFIVPAAIGMMFSTRANAQIVYTDVNPDIAVTCTVSTLNSSSSAMDSIDINNDGVFDLKLSVGGSWGGSFQNSTKSGSVKATPLNGSSIISNNSGYQLECGSKSDFRICVAYHKSNWQYCIRKLDSN
jgi:hypothetical protein